MGSYMILLSVILLTEVEIHQSQSGANENQELPRGEALTPTARRREVFSTSVSLTQNDCRRLAVGVRASPLGFYFCQMEMIGIDSKNPSVNTLVGAVDL